MKTFATVMLAAGIAAVTTSASAFGPCDNDRFYSGYAPYTSGSAPVPALTDEQIKAQQDAIAAQQKAAAEHFAQMEEQRQAYMRSIGLEP